MSPIDRTASSRTFDRAAGVLPPRGRNAGANGAATARALVAVNAPREPARPMQRPTDHSRAAFLAQLIAIREHLPQTRERRRATPEEAVAAYAAAMQSTAANPRAVRAREA